MKLRVVAAGIVLTAVAVTASCSRSVPSGIEVSKAFTPLISPGSTVLGGIDLEALKPSPLYAKYSSRLNDLGFDTLATEYGIDPRRDFNELLYVASERNQYFLVRGTFRTEQLDSKLESKGAKKSQYKGVELWQSPAASLALLKGPLVVLGRPGAVRGAIDTKENGDAQVPTVIANHLRSMPKGDQVWFVSRRGLPFASIVTRTEIQSALSNIVGYIAEATGSLRVDTGARLQAALYCSSAEGATRVHDALRATVAIGRLSTKDNQASLLKIYDAIQIERKENVVRLNAQLSGEQVDELATQMASRAVR